jgi:hypothetical protein
VARDVHILRTLTARISQKRKSLRNGGREDGDKFVLPRDTHSPVLYAARTIEQQSGGGTSNIETPDKFEMGFSVNLDVFYAWDGLGRLGQNHFGGAAGRAKGR